MMLDNRFVIAAALSFVSISATAQPLLKNGDFEATRQVRGTPHRDIGFGVWRLAANEAPQRWTVNSAYPGELRLPAQDARSGERFLRIRAQEKRDAHIYQPCPKLRPGKWYKVAVWLRGGPSNVSFYEYFADKKIQVQTIIQRVVGPDEWTRAVGFYTPAKEKFRSASVALSVTRGAAADFDLLEIEEIRQPPAPASLKPITLQNDLVQLKISSRGLLTHLVCKATGKNYAAKDAPLPMLLAQHADAWVPVASIEQEGNLLAVQFLDPEVRVSLRVTPKKQYFAFEVVDVEPAGMEGLRLGWPVKRLKTHSGAMNGTYDDEFGLCYMGVTPNVRCRASVRGSAVVSLTGECFRQHGIKGARSALVAAPFGQFKAAIQAMERGTGLPCPMLDGRWARDSDVVRRSYLFATRMHEDDVDSLIDAAKLGHFDTILILKNAFLETHGHFRINRENFPDGLASLKRAAAKIHAAGLRAGLHVFGPSISPNDPYVTPKPDDRLLYFPCPPLVEPVDAKAKTLTLAAQPNLPPKLPRSRAFPGYHVRVDDEIIRYSDLVGPPFRFIGCKRGACGTTAAPHAAGAQVRAMPSMWHFFLMNPDSTLLDEVTSHFARIVNECDIDMVYFDASDGITHAYMDRWYYLSKCHIAYYRKFKRDVLYQTSNGTGSQLWWHIVPRSASADGHGDLKWYLDQRLPGILRMKHNFTKSDIGWYGLDLGWTPDQLEYVCAKCLGADGSISVQANRHILENHPRAREIMETVGRYEQCRLANHFPETVKQKLLEKGKDFRLFDDGRGGWRILRAAYEPVKYIAALDGKSNVWTVNNDLGRPCRGAVEIWRSASVEFSAKYDDPRALVIEGFDDLTFYELSDRNQYEKYVRGAGRVVSPGGPVRKGVTQTLGKSDDAAPDGSPSAVYSATNTGDAYGWCGKGRRFAKPLDLSGYEALGLWVHGDGQRELFYFQLRDSAGRWCNCRAQVDFRGWRLLVFPTRAKGAAQSSRVRMRDGFDWKQVDYLILYFNSIRSGAAVSVELGALKAIPTVRAGGPLATPTLTVNGKAVRIPVTLDRGQCVTTDGLGACTLWPGGMKPGRPVSPSAATFTIKPGPNRIVFACADPAEFGGDAAVRVSRLWPLTD